MQSSHLIYGAHRPQKGHSCGALPPVSRVRRSRPQAAQQWRRHGEKQQTGCTRSGLWYAHRNHAVDNGHFALQPALHGYFHTLPHMSRATPTHACRMVWSCDPENTRSSTSASASTLSWCPAAVTCTARAAMHLAATRAARARRAPGATPECTRPSHRCRRVSRDPRGADRPDERVVAGGQRVHIAGVLRQLRHQHRAAGSQCMHLPACEGQCVRGSRP